MSGNFSVIESVTRVIEGMLETNGDRRNDSLKPFNCDKAPSISIADYILRITSKSRCSDSCVVVALILMNKMLARSSATLNAECGHRLVLSCLLVACKYNDESVFSNAVYASYGGVSKEELNRLEISLLDLLDFDIYVPEEEYQKYIRILSTYN